MILCGQEIKAGEKKKVQIPVPQADAIDVILFCGKEKGKTLVITAGVHGCEYVGIEAAKMLVQILNPLELYGNVILLPLINTQGFFQGSKQVVPEDNKNLNRMFPGSEDGTLSSRMAYAIEKNIYPYADFLIDLHGGDCNESMMPLVFYPSAGNANVNEQALEGAKALSVAYRVKSTAKNGLYSWAVQRGIPALLIERGANGLWAEQEVMDCIQDVFRIMSYLGIRNESFEMVKQNDIIDAVYEEAKSDGFWYPSVRVGKKVLKGEHLGYFYTYPKRKEIEIKAEFDAVILYYTTALGVKEKESLLAYGRI